MHNSKSKIWSQQPEDPEEPKAQSLVKPSRLQTQEESMFQFKSVGRRKLMFQLKAGGQRNSLLHENQTVCFIQAFISLDVTHHIRECNLLYLAKGFKYQSPSETHSQKHLGKCLTKCLCKHCPSKVHNKTLSITFS